jgi:hypothetical protein
MTNGLLMLALALALARVAAGISVGKVLSRYLLWWV